MPHRAPSPVSPHGMRAEAPRRWAECPRCAEHWPGGALYCGNCGWAPQGSAAAPQQPGGATATRSGPQAPPYLLALAVALSLVLGLLLWAWAQDDGGALAQLQTAAPSASASVPAAAPAPTVTTDAGLAAPPAASQPVAAADDGAAHSLSSDPRSPERFVRDWLAAEAGPADALPALRSHYADRVAYRGRPDADWAEIAADKGRFMRRWPGRRYELLSIQALEAGPVGEWRGALRVRWRLENQGRWRSGESVTALALRRVDGHWRIVAESALGPRPAPASAALPA